MFFLCSKPSNSFSSCYKSLNFTHPYMALPQQPSIKEIPLWKEEGILWSTKCENLKIKQIKIGTVGLFKNCNMLCYHYDVSKEIWYAAYCKLSQETFGGVVPGGLVDQGSGVLTTMTQVTVVMWV